MTASCHWQRTTDYRRHTSYGSAGQERPCLCERKARWRVRNQEKAQGILHQERHRPRRGEEKGTQVKVKALLDGINPSLFSLRGEESYRETFSAISFSVDMSKVERSVVSLWHLPLSTSFPYKQLFK